MKKQILILFLSMLISQMIFSQTSPGEQLANHIAQKMKDTLNLTSQQRDNVYTINMNLYQQKQNARQQYSGPTLGNILQNIEHTRDSLYNTVLPADLFLLYQQKKSNLVTSN